MSRIEYENSKFIQAIKERIHNERDREIMFLHYVQGWTAEQLANKYRVEPRQIFRICAKRLKEIQKYL